ncbi:bifunctional [glutamine synthetase] adenylyltransferase/[glutamine synthetase]-adenylyl-L-tyrosine phosphorylase [Actinomyces weissii]|uniref:Bifunctional [glutamine synthetase] adenylyltransferase/[glutamine synthetase]-adenylyl-L-tyrosine phosphorylase n=1 Tax=Actinomyces weissii TaxID=675090 RepID=A0A7T7S342_9ACTO|nr:bifunctional [glutamine synthetase] adenylyltransferase/[glutamine synthetase]-adenylyl-L-tyrosine phosphorylase [Actinomyces weissii]QQM68129.1 bifunctional [glutamine synthetase] adenylyltransferase/[glutamine synthetase]-adenylyl-L-tyrosine phosphorylase [Actinomyces weissii]
MAAPESTEPPRLGRVSPRARLLRAGFVDTGRALRLLADPLLNQLLGLTGWRQPIRPQQLDGLPAPAQEQEPEPPAALLALAQDLGETADPDLALLCLTRLAQASLDASPAQPSPPGQQAAPAAATRLQELLSAPAGQPPHAQAQAHRARLFAVLGASQALGDFLVAHPEHLEELAPARAWDAPGQPPATQVLTEAVQAALADGGPEPGTRRRAAVNALRRAYYQRLLVLAADDLLSPDPQAHVSVAWRRLTDLADAALQAALLLAQQVHGQHCPDVSLAVIALGKCGARELNYVSDVDVVHVVGPAPGRPPVPEEQLVAQGTVLAAELARVVAGPADEPALWPLDTALRPEGKDGALVRTVSSHLNYYERWAASWEFQALLKARTCAGDRELGAAYEQAIAPLVWNAAGREHFVQDARDMRRRVEHDSQRPGEDLRLKLGPGGLRDVEFTVQLLQLVHGRSDESLRGRGTLEALEALTAGGYVGREDAAALAAGYRELRLLEHRSQLFRLRRTHTLPTRDRDLRRLARGLGRGQSDPEEVKRAFTAVRRRVRALHEEIYYRPLLGAVADLSTEEMRLSPQAARERLAASGYLDPDGALRHLQALTEGVSRAAAIQRQLLPVMIGWIGDGPDPDLGLLSFRLLSETAGRTHWYLGMLRDSPVAARRLARVLSGSRWTTELLREMPETIAWLDDDAELRPRPPGAVADEVRRVLSRRPLRALAGERLEQAAAEAVQAVMGVRHRELVRAALADAINGVDVARTGRVLSDAVDAVLGAALEVATVLAVRERLETAGSGGPVGDEPPGEADGHAGGPGVTGLEPLAEHVVVALGRLGGAETSYVSDADVLFAHRPRAGADPAAAAREAESVARHTIRLLAQAQPHPLVVDPDLRPEGRQGVLSRSLDSYREYYAQWAAVWERQALVRARLAAGDPGLGRELMELIDSVRWRPQGLSRAELREIRRLKARMETERLPQGVRPAHHLKLGPGGLSDVEWTVQVLQLAHAGQVPQLRSPSTLRALEAATECGLLTAQEAERLETSWTLAGQIRSALVLGTGRTTGGRLDVFPANLREARMVAALLGAPDPQACEDRYLRAARRARAVVEKVLRNGDAGRPAGPGAQEEPQGGSGEPCPGSQPTAPASSTGSASSVGTTRSTGTPAPSPGRDGADRRPGTGAAAAGPQWTASPPGRRRPGLGTGPYPWS